MARLPLLDDPDLGQADDPLLNAGYGVFRTLGHSPGAAVAFWRPVRYILHEGGFDPRLREFVILTVAWVTRTAYAWSHHIRVSRNAGIPDEDLRALVDHLEGRSSTLETEALAVVDAARELTRTATLGDGTFERLAARFPPAQLAELVFMMANYNSVMRVLNGLRVDVEPDFEPYLAEFPLPSSPA